MKRPGILIAFLVLAAIAIASAFFFYPRAAVSPPTPGSSQSGSSLTGGPFALLDGPGELAAGRSPAATS